jgi:hypothetical protein
MILKPMRGPPRSLVPAHAAKGTSWSATVTRRRSLIFWGQKKKKKIKKNLGEGGPPTCKPRRQKSRRLECQEKKERKEKKNKKANFLAKGRRSFRWRSHFFADSFSGLLSPPGFLNQ